MAALSKTSATPLKAFPSFLAVFEKDGLDEKWKTVRRDSDNSITSTVMELPDGTWVVVLGFPCHPRCAANSLAALALDHLVTDTMEAWKEWSGLFAVIAWMPVERRAVVVTDLLGIFPVFCSVSDQRLVITTEVTTCCREGWVDTAVDDDAVASFVCYGYNLTHGSLVKALKRVRPATVLQIGALETVEVRYAELVAADEDRSEAEVADGLYERINRSCETCLRDVDEVSLPLSGGYDSRFLLAMVRRRESMAVHCVNVPFTAAEGRIAGQAATALGADLRSVAFERSWMDSCDEFFHLTPDGFPISKQASFFSAQFHPGLPSINGYLGDNIFRGTHDRCFGCYEHEFKEDLTDVLHRWHLMTRWLFYKPGYAALAQERGREAMKMIVGEGRRFGKVFAWSDFYGRQRFYISNNFLEHARLAPALLPFFDHSLLQYKVETHDRVFERPVFQQIFEKHFPALASIPHSDKVAQIEKKKQMVSLTARRAALALLKSAAVGALPSILRPAAVTAAAVAALAGVVRAERFVFEVERLRLLEETVNSLNISFEWTPR